jgi:hypothetical protein
MQKSRLLALSQHRGGMLNPDRALAQITILGAQFTLLID